MMQPGAMDVAQAAPGLGRAQWRAVWQGICAAWREHRPVRRLRVRETVSLGERRMLAVVEWNGRQLLVGGTATSLTLLAEGSVEAMAPGGDLPCR
jgi:hypothetical protein